MFWQPTECFLFYLLGNVTFFICNFKKKKKKFSPFNSTEYEDKCGISFKYSIPTQFVAIGLQFESNWFCNYQKLWNGNYKRQLTVLGIPLLPIATVTTKPAIIVTKIQLQKKKLGTLKRQRIYIRKTNAEQIFRGLHHRKRFFIGLHREDLQSVCQRNFDFWCSCVRFWETFNLNRKSNLLRPISRQLHVSVASFWCLCC